MKQNRKKRYLCGIMYFRDVIGQTDLKKKLIRMASSGRVGHGLLFSGKAGNGGLPLAVAYARYLNCQSPTGEDACGECSSCRQMDGLTHPDLHFVYPVNKSKHAESTAHSEGDKPVSEQFVRKWREQVLSAVPKGYFHEKSWYRTLEIENKQGLISRNEAAEILRRLSFKSFASPYKILILWLPERMNEPAANALLKILEEPWEKTLFFLVSESPVHLLKTILSRVQEITVPAIETDELARWMAGRYPGGSDADAIARISFGDVLEAVRMKEEKEGDEMFDLFVRLMRLSYENKHLELMDWADQVAALGREGQKMFLDKTARLLRESYILSMNADGVSYLYGKELAFCRKFSPYVHNGNIDSLIRETERTVRDVVQNGNARIVFTHYALAVSKLIARRS